MPAHELQLRGASVTVHRAVAAAREGVVFHVAVAQRQKARVEQTVLLGAAEPVDLRLADENADGRQIGGGMRKRREGVDLGKKLRIGVARVFAHVEVLGHLPGLGHEAGEIGGLEAVGREPLGIHADHGRQVAAAGRTAHKDLLRIAAIFGDVPERPGKRGRRVADRVGRCDFAHETVAHGHAADAVRGIPADLAIATAPTTHKATAMVPHDDRKVGEAHGKAQIQPAPLLLQRIGLGQDVVGIVRDVLDVAEAVGDGSQGRQCQRKRGKRNFRFHFFLVHGGVRM